MASYSRKHSIGKGTDGTYQAYSRCLEHTVLDGIHPESGATITNRRRWIAKRVGELRDVFAVEVLALSVREREVALVLSCQPEVAGKWSPEEVVWRWTNLFGQSFGNLDRDRFSDLAGKKSLVAEWRKRLTSVSWFMRGFNEWLARKINKEEGRKGRFWDDRFRCEKIGDQEIARKVAGLEGRRIPVPASRKLGLFPGLKALPEATVKDNPKGKRGKRGVRGPWLTPDQKIEIRRRLAEGESAADLARVYARSTVTISKLERIKHGDDAAIAGAKLKEVEREYLRQLVLRRKPRRSKNGRFFYHPNDVHALAEKTFGRKLYHHPFEKFCRELRNG